MGEIPAGLPALQLEMPSLDFLARAVEPALVLALIGSVVSLLTSLVADSLTRTSHDPDRELIGQGVGNMAAGVVGGLPGGGTPVYTVPNIRAGGTTRAAGVTFSVFLLALLLGLGPFVESIPLAALAAVLIKVGWDLVDWHLLTRLRRLRRDHAVVMVTTLALAVFVDLVVAVAVGLVISALARAEKLERTEHDSVVSVPLLDQVFLHDGKKAEDSDPFSARVGMVALRGSLTVTSSRSLVRTISMDLAEHELVIFDFSDATYIDDSAAMLVRQLIEIATDEKTPAIAMGPSGEVAGTLSRSRCPGRGFRRSGSSRTSTTRGGSRERFSVSPRRLRTPGRSGGPDGRGRVNGGRCLRPADQPAVCRSRIRRSRLVGRPAPAPAARRRSRRASRSRTRRSTLSGSSS